MSNTTLLVGAPSLSAFRIERLLRALAPRAPGLKGIKALDFFLVEGEGVDAAVLARLLDAEAGDLPRADGAAYVVPRLGTLSPWSSKATDIARVCGLAGVKRIERGRAYLFGGVKGLPHELLAELHDPMTESVVTDAAQLSGVFAQQPARPLRTVDLLGGGKARGAGAHDADALGALAARLDRLHPALIPSGVGDVLLDRADRDRVEALLDHAVAFAQTILAASPSTARRRHARCSR